MHVHVELLNKVYKVKKELHFKINNNNWALSLMSAMGNTPFNINII